MESLRKSASERLRELRESKKAEAKSAGRDWRQWTQASVAQDIGVDTVTYQRWEAGTSWPEMGPRLDRLAQRLGVSPGYFLDGPAEAATTTGPTLSDLARGDAKILERLVAIEKRLPAEAMDAQVADLRREIEQLRADLKTEKDKTSLLPAEFWESAMTASAHKVLRNRLLSYFQDFELLRFLKMGSKGHYIVNFTITGEKKWSKLAEEPGKWMKYFIEEFEPNREKYEQMHRKSQGAHRQKKSGA